ncbi:50S ribosomal protein L27 [Gemmata sp. SH-PL17]|uniref:Large ribosomal subunit protein bL27 n=1 Tax=Gemmata massiliana TaxID=1210884 RepID=A0A6P2DF63_9BACT|nr:MULTISPECIES: 50S ribosomal protein L27 [Gemmata]AMV23541.1 50S ribosomal protein L27 [Gemmata sp. SH-PL17]VTR99910.1 50s ribosomal protein l27 : 50S ribosomal protein L27 OS=Planctomyces maris DSM 8797 GN=rpmA PE=3 SV=1: Ribosomal_L27 [Gemmata massiliana]
MAHKKGQGSVRNGRDSLSKRRGLKAYGGQAVTIGSIIVTQCGTRYSPGRFVRLAKNSSIFALVAGKVYFDQGGKRINVLPDDATATAIG